MDVPGPADSAALAELRARLAARLLEEERSSAEANATRQGRPTTRGDVQARGLVLLLERAEAVLINLLRFEGPGEVADRADVMAVLSRIAALHDTIQLAPGVHPAVPR